MSHYMILKDTVETRATGKELVYLLKDGDTIATGKYRWVNRPWQRYDFHMALLDLLTNVSTSVIEDDACKELMVNLSEKVDNYEGACDMILALIEKGGSNEEAKTTSI